MREPHQPALDHLYWVFRSGHPGESYGPFLDLAWAQAKATEIGGIVFGVRVVYTGVPAQVQKEETE